ncbi:MAG: translation initiation factor IF-2 [Zetaproteobacteria bacterium CG17_big_fil_post_rev_8_21_14_2_50_50_13]|nr:MAG: translation initiation factor IF-2 [Zetaproteobacteria bacterium CG17_big_fil_post_rev_8_21_14_2_50_50_13]
MAKKRMLDLAKELGVDVSDIQDAAVKSNVAVSGPTTALTEEDVGKIKLALRNKSDSGNRRSTLTLSQTSLGGSGRSSSMDSKGHSVQVAVRRRRVVKPAAVVKPQVEMPLASHPVAEPVIENKPEVIKAAAPEPLVQVKPAEKVRALSPAQSAALAMEKKKMALIEAEERRKAEASKPVTVQSAAVQSVVAQPTAAQPTAVQGAVVQGAVVQKETAPEVKAPPVVSQPAKPAAPVQAQQATRQGQVATRAQAPGQRPQTAQRPQTPGQRPQAGQQRPQTPGQRPMAGQRPMTPGQRPQERTAEGERANQGPRTTIRRGLTPAQIAASKAPRSSLKQIEDKISKDKADRRRAQQKRPATSTQQRPTDAPNRAPVTSQRPPSVAVAPDPSATQAAPKRKQGAAARPQRRLTPAEKAARRTYSEKRHQVLTPQQEERMARLAKGGRKRGALYITKDDAEFVVREVEITDPIIVSELASRMAIKSPAVIKKLFEMGNPTTTNETIDADTAVLIVEEFGHKPKLINEAAIEDELVFKHDDVDDENLKPRPPVVVVMGHVDHGKTSILDALRRANVADGEAGGITQHIGAYMVKLESGERVVFVDTPGHEAFTSLRARGANMTDVAVLVVAADDGVMPQTVEALNHAKAAGVPIIVAVNKMDKEGADPEKVMRQLSEYGILPEAWGGETIFVNVSAHTGQGLDELLEMLALQTEILELRANPERTGRGVVIESRLDKGRGPVATVLVQNGTFRKGDIVVVGTVMGRIRAIVDENNVQHRTAGPSIPFELLGLETVCEAGQEIIVVESERKARDVMSYRKEKERQMGVAQHKCASMDELFAAVQSGIVEVPVLIKGDVTGSVEALADSLVKAGTDDVKVRIIHKGLGAITETDIMLASAGNAIVIGFNVRPESKAKKMAEAEGVDVRFYKIIYDAIDEMKLAMAGQLSPDKVEHVTGAAEVREVFTVPKIGAIAGSYMTEGFVTRKSKVRVLRDSVLVYDGQLESLKRFKDDVKEVKAGYECGIGVEKFNDVKVGDTFEFYEIKEVAATL